MMGSGPRKRAGSSALLLTSLAGAVVGLAALYPYVLLSYLFMHPGSAHPALFGGRPGLPTLFRQAEEAFHQHWPLMHVSFALFGLLAGTLFGLFLRQRRRTEAEMIERAHREAALETLRQLMVTLSHYLLNIAAVVGGHAQRSLRRDPEGTQREAMAAIAKKAQEMEAVVASLQSLTAVATELYTGGGEDRMIDIRRELEEKLQGSAPVA